MKLTKNSWHYNAYLFLTGKTPNNNFCDYFWELLFNLIFFIPNIPFYLTTIVYSKVEKANKTISWNEKDYKWITEPKSFEEKLQANNKIPLYLKVFASIIISFIIGTLGYFAFNNPFQLLTLIAGVIIGLLLIFGVVYYFTTSNTPERIKDNIVEFFSMIEEAFIAFKNNYCPKIDWTDKN